MLITAIALAAAVLGYFLVTTLVELPPLNNVAAATLAERRTETLVNAPVLLAPVVLLGLAGALHTSWLGYAGAGVEAVAVLSGLALWWLPYLTGRSVPWATAGTGDTWAQLHDRTYARTVIVLPRIGDRPRPNLEHMILHTLMVAAAVTAFIASAQQ